VQTVDTQGQPIAGVAVFLVAATDSNARTGSDGNVTLSFTSRHGTAILYAGLTGYHSAKREFPLAATGSPNLQRLTLMRTEEARLVLRGVTSQLSADASRVVVSADIGVIGLNGNPITGLSAANFTVPQPECAAGGACILDVSGKELNGWYIPWNPVEVTLSGVGPSSHYNVRYVLEPSERGMFTAGRTVLSTVEVRVGADTWLDIYVNVRL
jgi:hypothetical protein